MELRDGITYMHEHMTIDLSKQKGDLDCRLDLFDETLDEINKLTKLNVKNIVDVTNKGMGRDIEFIKRLEKESGINIISATGYYKEPFLLEEVYQNSAKDISKIIVDEIVYGIDESDKKAEIIGEIGTSKEAMTPMEKKVFEAAARAHIDTGTPITTHTTLGKLGLEQISLLKEFDVDLNKVIIGHVDLSGDLDYILRLIDKGVYVDFDTVGKINYMEDEIRADIIKELCNRDLHKRIFLSMDITRKSHLKNRGGLGYSYLLDTFIPLLKKRDINEEKIKEILINNPKKFFS